MVFLMGHRYSLQALHAHIQNIALNARVVVPDTTQRFLESTRLTEKPGLAKYTQKLIMIIDC